MGRTIFAAAEAELIADVVARDIPYLTAGISHEFVDGMTDFQRHMGLIHGAPHYEDIVATQFSSLWGDTSALA